ncbi:DUF3466 family protein [Photobacterium alginatilyticum]|uniref:DUF3466 family protein n=1 Tax=Photobacterium alginatilyticum TaxID=1775171 RepID=A0ABW9YQ22_9GAMM|nr:DUF3466 family protein [Photobacterium alginatilyticum]NBI55495.1 DUF3466 family protein [Photobacterium alginatilyticum]
MQHKTLKLSTLAVLIASVTQANAAVYQVVEVDGASSGVGSLQYYSKNTSDVQSRVEFYAQGVASSGSENCFTQSCDASTYAIFGESRLGSDGINYRDEVPFISDNRQESNDYFSLRSYCINNLGFNTCDDWANTAYYGLNFNEENVQDGSGFGGLHREHVAWNENFYSNAFPLTEATAGALSRVTTFAEDASSYDPATVAALGTKVSTHETTNGVVNRIGQFSGNDFQLGITSSAYFESNNRYARQFNKRGFVNAGATPTKSVLNPVLTSEALVTQMGQTLAWDAVEYNGQLLVVGSASFSTSKLSDDNKLPSDSDAKDRLSLNDGLFENCATTASDVNNLFTTKECQFSVFANDAAFWTVDNTGAASANAKPLAERVDSQNRTYPALDPDNDQIRSFQASARAVALVGGQPVAAGFSTDSIANNSVNTTEGDYYAVRAAIYKPKSGFSVDSGQWERTIIPGLDIEEGNDRKLRFSMATDINSNNKVIGFSKNVSSENRSYAETMFVYDNTAGTLKKLDTSIDSTIFFQGANGFPSSINNKDQVVGWVDSESVNQVNGRQRRQRAFTYMAGADIEGSPLQSNKAWMLDDLTNGGSVSTENNAFRIAHATDVNDAGIISATAFKCEGGYQSLTKESQCSTDEKVVAVKLVPIVGGTIEQRPEEQSTIKREGASLGLFALTLLGLIGFRRRK